MIQPARLLIVDDEDAIIRLLTQFLTSRGYLVCWADRAVTCLDALDEFPDIRIVLLAYQTIDQPGGARSPGQASGFVHPGEAGGRLRQ